MGYQEISEGRIRSADAIVKMVSHEDLESQIIGFYSGKKESKKTIVQQYFQGQDTLTGAYSFDALHTCPTLLEELENKGGVYLAQIKKNQKELLGECQHMVQNLPFRYDFEDLEKAHSRIEHRIAGLYPLEVATLDERCRTADAAKLWY